MSEINLLPIELSPARGAVKVAKNLNKGIVIAVGAFLLLSLFGVIFIVYLSIQISSSVTAQNSLKQNIAALVGTEQKVVLTKNRLDKIKLVLSNKDGGDSFQTLDKVLSTLPANVAVNTVDITPDKTAFSVISKDSLNMATFLNTLVVNGVYKNITLTGFIFTPDNGYTISFASS